MKPSPLLLNRSVVDELVLRTAPDDATIPDTQDVTVTTSIEMLRSEQDPKQWLCKLRVVFAGAKEPAKCSGEIVIRGFFTAPSWPEEETLKMVAVTCPSILYATAREMVATVSGRFPHGVFTLPLVSFSDHNLKPRPTSEQKVATEKQTKAAV